jgi:hypothetical protein
MRILEQDCVSSVSRLEAFAFPPRGCFGIDLT